MSSKKTILYLRTDICNEELTAGGSVAHTVGVITGFVQLGYDVTCASSAMHQVLTTLPLKQLILLANPTILTCLRWKLNSFLSTFFFARIVMNKLKHKNIEFIYQRYSLLNATGLLLAWWYKKKLILEYNGSEAWIANNWTMHKRGIRGLIARWIKFEWLMKQVELANIHHADMIVVVSEVLKDELVTRGVQAHNILVNPNGVDADVYKPIKKRL